MMLHTSYTDLLEHYDLRLIEFPIKFVAFSGGKDSTALALSMPDAIPVFTDTKWEFKEIYHWIERFERETGRKVYRITHPKYPGGLPEYIKASKFLPGHGSRYCTRIFKIEAMNLFYKRLGFPVELCIGLRADEPEDYRVGKLSEIDGLNVRYPFREWGWDVWQILRTCTRHDLLPRYPAYMAAGGCIGCFYKRKSEVQAMVAMIPESVDRLQELEESVQDDREQPAYMFPNMGMSIRELRQQGTLFDMKQVYEDAADRSGMGRACGLFCRR